MIVGLLVILPCCGGSTEVSGDGVTTGLQTRTLTCGTHTSLSRYESGFGNITIHVTDGAGRDQQDDSGGLAGQVNDDQPLDGTAGEWKLSVDPGGFSGQFKITLSCAN